MAKPKIAATRSAIVDLEPGTTYYYCRCGLSQSQPFCDDSHLGTEFSPLLFEVTEAKKYPLCQCKRTTTPPYCDGTHKELRR